MVSFPASHERCACEGKGIHFFQNERNLRQMDALPSPLTRLAGHDNVSGLVRFAYAISLPDAAATSVAMMR